METIYIATDICEYLENISSNTKSLYDCLGLLKSQDVYKSLIQKSENILRSVDGQMENTKKIYNEFSSSIKTICDKYMNEVKKMKEMSQNDIKTLKNDFEEIKNELNMKKEELKKLSLQNEEKTTFIYRNQVKSKVNMELVMKYPSSYFYKEYNSDRRTADGDIFIDIDDTNDELIVKYMKDDDSFIEDVRKMEKDKIFMLIEDLSFLSLPIKETIKHLGRNEDNEIMEAWRDQKVVKVNEKNVKEINDLLKKKKLMNSLFEAQLLKDIHYDKEGNSFYINLNMKFVDVIEDYLKNNHKFNSEVLMKYRYNGSAQELINEMEIIGLNLNKQKLHDIDDYMAHASQYFPTSTIIDIRHDSYLKEWAGDWKWKLIYRASEHRYTAKSFHKYCDNVKGPTLVIIKSSEGYIFGGYTTQSWSGEGIYLI